VMPNLPITLFTDHLENIAPFDRIAPIPPRAVPWDIERGAAGETDASQGLVARVKYAYAADWYDETLMLDSDVWVKGPLRDVFDLLSRFDVALAHAPVRDNWVQTDVVAGVPDAFPTLNCGVVAFRRCDAVAQVFARWWSLYERQLRDGWRGTDQPALRRALWEGDARLAVLPEEYNFRVVFPRVASGPVKVLHGRPTSQEAIYQLTASEEYFRIWLPPGNEGRSKQIPVANLIYKETGPEYEASLPAHIPDYEAIMALRQQIPRALCNERETRFLAYIAATAPAGTFVELGSYQGGSTIVLAGVVARRNSRVIAIDDYLSLKCATFPEKFEPFGIETLRRNIAPAGGDVTLFETRSHIVPEGVDDVSLLFIDSDHCGAALNRELDAWLPKMAPESIILLHDYADRFPDLVEVINHRLGVAPEWKFIARVQYMVAFRKVG